MRSSACECVIWFKHYPSLVVVTFAEMQRPQCCQHLVLARRVLVAVQCMMHVYRELVD